VKRRSFLQATGATGLFLFFRGVPLDAAPAPLVAPRPAGYPADWNAYLRIGPDGRVGCFTGKVELGQGIMTALPMLIAEELDVALDKVDILMGDTDLCPWDNATGGSTTLWQTAPALRGAAAEARAVLLRMAGERLASPVEALEVRLGVVSVKGAPERRVSYAELAQGRRLEKFLGVVKPKDLKARTLTGMSPVRKDALEKVTGAARYVADLGFPGTLHAFLLRPPAHGLRLKTFDGAEAERVPGARVVRDGDLAAVLHEDPAEARRALARVKATFEGTEPAVDDATIHAHLVANAPALRSGAKAGDLKEGEARASVRAEAEYLNDYVAHAPMEPHGAVARWEGGRMTVWLSTQAPFAAKAQVAQALGLPADKVRIITPYVGGAFGGKLPPAPHAVEAARLARITGRPVQVMWTRKEEFFLDTYRPAAAIRIRSGVDRNGRISFWDYQVHGIGDRESDIGYTLPVQQVRFSGDVPAVHPVLTGAWRAPAAVTNTFARESHMDVLAAKAGRDPLAFRLDHLTDPRMIKLLRKVADRFGWTPGPAGRGCGMAIGAWRGGLAAAMAEVAVDRKTGHVQVKRVVHGLDLGIVVNPEGVRQQVEGGTTMGLGQALTEGLRFKGGKVLDENFDTYTLPRFSWVPRIEVVLGDSPEVPSQGCGEPAIVCMGAVLANAVADAIGARVFQLPMTPERVLEAIRRGRG